MSAARWLVFSSLWWLVSTPVLAQVQPRTFQLTIERDEGSSACPDRLVFQRRVATRLGYDSFVEEGATRRVHVQIRHEDSVRTAQVELYDEAGQRIGARDLQVAGDDGCAELSESIVLSVAIAIDPLARDPTVPSERPAPAAPSPEASSSASRGRASTGLRPERVSSRGPERSEPHLSDPVRARLGLGVEGVAATAPSVTGGLALSGGFEWRAFAMDVSVRAELPVTTEHERGSFETFLFSAALLPCAHVEFVSLCGVFRAGALRAAGRNVTDQVDVTTPWIGLGARTGVEVSIDPRVRLTFAVELTGTVAQTNVIIGSTRVWTTEPIAGALSGGIVLLP